MTFGEIDLAIQQLFESSVDAETGEIIAVDEQLFMAKMDELCDMREEKIDRLVGAFKYYSTLADGIKAEKMILAKRQQIAENRAESIKTFLSHLLNGEKIEKPQYKIGWRKSTTVQIKVDAEALPEEYRKIKYEADKTGIKSALKEGAVIDGCELVESNSIQIK